MAPSDFLGLWGVSGSGLSQAVALAEPSVHFDKKYCDLNGYSSASSRINDDDELLVTVGARRVQLFRGSSALVRSGAWAS